MGPSPKGGQVIPLIEKKKMAERLGKLKTNWSIWNIQDHLKGKKTVSVGKKIKRLTTQRRKGRERKKSVEEKRMEGTG